MTLTSKQPALSDAYCFIISCGCSAFLKGLQASMGIFGKDGLKMHIFHHHYAYQLFWDDLLNNFWFCQGNTRHHLGRTPLSVYNHKLASKWL
jgi:hypothetical protein